MADNTGWDKTTPLGTDAVSSGDDQIRSFKSYMQAWWNDEHYGTDGSALSAGKHKPGAGRAYQAAATSALSNPTISGQLMHITGNNSLWLSDPSNSTWTLVTNSLTLGSVNTWSAKNVFTSSISVHNSEITQDLTMGGSISQVSTTTLKVGGTASLTFIGSGTTASWNPGSGSLASFAFDSTPVDVTGALAGDIVICEQPYQADSFALKVTGRVSASNVVTAVCQNVSNGPNTPSARALDVVVFRPG